MDTTSDENTIRLTRVEQHIEALHASHKINSRQRYELRSALRRVGLLDVTPNDLRRILKGFADPIQELFEQFFVPQTAATVA